MNWQAVIAVVGICTELARLDPSIPRPPLPADAPTEAAAQAIWREWVEAVSLADGAALRRLIHSSRRLLFTGPPSPDLAYELGFCKPQQPVLRTGEDEIAYCLVCEGGGERVEKFLYLRRDVDGVWRIRP